MATHVPASPELVLLEFAAYRRLLFPGEAPLEATSRLLRAWLRDRGSTLRAIWLWRVEGDQLGTPQALPVDAEAPPMRPAAVREAEPGGPVVPITASSLTGKARVALRYGDQTVGAFAAAWSGPASHDEVSRALQAVLARLTSAKAGLSAQRRPDAELVRHAR